MKKSHVEKSFSAESVPDGATVVATFGEARLVRLDGRMKLFGGAMADRLEALEWLSMFMPGELLQENKITRENASK